MAELYNTAEVGQRHDLMPTHKPMRATRLCGGQFAPPRVVRTRQI